MPDSDDAFDAPDDRNGFAEFWDDREPPETDDGFDTPAEDEALLDRIVDHLAATGAYDDDVVEAELVEDGAEIEHVGFDDAIPLSPVVALRRGLLAMDDARQELARQGNVDDLARGVADITVISADLAALQRSARLDIANLMLAAHVDGDGKAKRGNPKHEVEGLGIVDVPGGNEWKDWDSENLLRDLMIGAILDGGELKDFGHPHDVVEAIFDVLVACLPVTASLGWRVGQQDKATGEWTGLRGQGIDPEDYASRVAKDRLAVVPKRKLDEEHGS